MTFSFFSCCTKSKKDVVNPPKNTNKSNHKPHKLVNKPNKLITKPQINKPIQ
jgi:hypothetical protein